MLYFSFHDLLQIPSIGLRQDNRKVVWRERGKRRSFKTIYGETIFYNKNSGKILLKVVYWFTGIVSRELGGQEIEKIIRAKKEIERKEAKTPKMFFYFSSVWVNPNLVRELGENDITMIVLNASPIPHGLKYKTIQRHIEKAILRFEKGYNIRIAKQSEYFREKFGEDWARKIPRKPPLYLPPIKFFDFIVKKIKKASIKIKKKLCRLHTWINTWMQTLRLLRKQLIGGNIKPGDLFLEASQLIYDKPPPGNINVIFGNMDFKG